MGGLKVSLFGSMRVSLSSGGEEVKLSRTISLLLAYLLLERHRMHPREVLADLFWANYDQERARNCLNTALWRLRRSLETPKCSYSPYLLASEGEVGFNRESEYWLDVDVFEAHLLQIFKRPVEQMDSAGVAELEDILRLYQGDLLEGVYEDWALQAREQKRLLYLNGLMYLVQYYKHHESYERALEFGRKILHADPLREEIHREVMRLYLLNGQRVMAIQQYQVCRHNLAEEMGIPPMEETENLYKQILTESDKVPLHPPLESSDNLHEVIQQLQQASKNLDLATDQFCRALRYLEELIVEYPK